MEEKISVIIPVYKVEEYLEICIDSVLKQTYKNLEIILVDDGSPDNCGKICDKYAEKDERIKVIHKENAGVARARNDGIEVATGEYISFIDSDDWISENAYEVLYKGMKQYDADCSVGCCVRVTSQEGVLVYEEEKGKRIRVCTSEDAMKGVLLRGSAVWNRLFKRKIFKEVRFPLDRINDDEVVALHAYAECKKIVFLDENTYYYRIRNNSITTSSFSIKNIDCYYNSAENLQFILKICPSLEECAKYKYFKSMLYCYVNLRKLERNEEKKKIKAKIKCDIKKNWKSLLENAYLNVFEKLGLLLLGM